METLREKQWTLGGETSGHIINLDACHTGDAIISTANFRDSGIDEDNA